MVVLLSGLWGNRSRLRGMLEDDGSARLNRFDLLSNKLGRAGDRYSSTHRGSSEATAPPKDGHVLTKIAFLSVNARADSENHHRWKKNWPAAEANWVSPTRERVNLEVHGRDCPKLSVIGRIIFPALMEVNAFPFLSANSDS
jgi:hypothetical protein